MISQIKTLFFRLGSSSRARVDLAIFGIGITLSVLAGFLFALDRDRLQGMLIQFAELEYYQFSNPPFDPKGFDEFVRDFAIQNAQAPAIALALSVAVILAFAFKVIARSIKSTKVRLSLSGDKSLHGGYRLAIGLGTVFLTLAIFPGAILASASEDVVRAFSEVEKNQAEVWSSSEGKLSDALAASLNAHSERLRHQTAKIEAQIDCRGSSNAQTYYLGDGYTNPGFYNSCRLSDYLDRIDSRTESLVFGADYRLKGAQISVDFELAKLNGIKENLQIVQFVQEVIRNSQLSLLLIAGASIFVTFIAVTTKFRGVKTGSISGRSLLVGPGIFTKRVKCPKCAEYVKSEALICKHCGFELH